jgi:putative hydrolase of the HAD superfamily
MPEWLATTALRQYGLVTGLTDGISAVVFDFFGTLTPVSPSQVWAGNAARLAAALGVPVAEFVQVLDETFPERITGAFGDVRQTMQALADRLCVRLDAGQLDEAARVRRQVQESMFALRPEALSVIEELRGRGKRIGLVSDCTAELPDAWERLPLDPVVDVPVFSCIEGTRKPDPRLFRKVAAALGEAPASCLYVGDGGGQELTGASEVGMRAVLLAGPDWHAYRDPRREENWAGLRISSLTELCR